MDDLLCVGRSTQRKLINIGINTIGDLVKADEKILVSHLGKMADVIRLIESKIKDELQVPRQEA